MSNSLHQALAALATCGLAAGVVHAEDASAVEFSGSGFLLFLLVVSGDMDAGFAGRATRVIALAAVAVALVGVLEVMLGTQAGVDRILKDRLPWVTEVKGGVDDTIDFETSQAMGTGSYVPKFD